MVGLLVVLFVVVPLVELYVIVTVAGAIGVVPTLALLLAVSVGGAWLVKRQGLGVWRRTQAAVQRGEVPASEVVDGAVLLGAGSLLLVPGFVTDTIGLLLLVPPVRAVFRHRLLRRWGPVGTRTMRGGRVVDVEFVGDATGPGTSPGSGPSGPAGRPPELGSGA